MVAPKDFNEIPEFMWRPSAQALREGPLYADDKAFRPFVAIYIFGADFIAPQDTDWADELVCESLRKIIDKHPARPLFFMNWNPNLRCWPRVRLLLYVTKPEYFVATHRHDRRWLPIDPDSESSDTDPSVDFGNISIEVECLDKEKAKAEKRERSKKSRAGA